MKIRKDDANINEPTKPNTNINVVGSAIVGGD